MSIRSLYVPDPAASAVRRHIWWSLLLWFLRAFALAGTVSCAAAGEAPALAEIRRAEVVVSNATAVPADDAGWKPVALTHREKKPGGLALVQYWYRMPFSANPGGTPLWVYFPGLPSGGDVYLNGALVGEVPDATDRVHVRWYRPHLLLLPPVLLRPGSNMLAVHLSIREPLTSFGPVQVGSETILRPQYDRLLFWEETIAEISTAICLLAGSLIIAFWLRRPQERLYGLFGFCMLFWGVRTLLLHIPVVPVPAMLLWRCAYYFSTAGFIVLITGFMLKFSGRAHPRLTRIMVGYWLIGCLVFAAGGQALRPLMNSWWLPGFLPWALYSAVQLCRFALRQRTRASFAMGLAVVLALMLSLHDFAVQEAWFGLPEIYLMHLAIPSFLLVMTGVLSDRFLESLKRVESVNEQLALKVAAREKEIAESYRRVQVLERANAATEERQRIMRDMHDGVGSQLLTALVMVERGAASREVTVLLLQECLDDMRLAIESLSPDDPDLLPVLGNFRFRMEARFKSMGLTLDWRSQDMPDALEVAPHAGLHILRMLQEALANVLKHAQASAVQVALDFSASSLAIEITDNGVGFDPARARGGRGLDNMQIRAQKLGASCIVSHLPGGTCVRFVIPLRAIRAASAPGGAAHAALPALAGG